MFSIFKNKKSLSSVFGTGLLSIMLITYQTAHSVTNKDENVMSTASAVQIVNTAAAAKQLQTIQDNHSFYENAGSLWNVSFQWSDQYHGAIELLGANILKEIMLIVF